MKTERRGEGKRQNAREQAILRRQREKHLRKIKKKYLGKEIEESKREWPHKCYHSKDFKDPMPD